MDERGDCWLEWAKELQFLSQCGLAYTKDPYDKERFERVREISAEILSRYSGMPVNSVKELFCNETGYQTPKLDTRAAIFSGDRILLVQEKDGRWSLPGGWVDALESVRSNIIKEVKEEAGLDIKPARIIAVQDRNLHNLPPYAYGICKVFVLCEPIGGEFRANIETVDSGYFGLDDLPPLAENKSTKEQIAMCFEAKNSNQWEVPFD